MRREEGICCPIVLAFLLMLPASHSWLWQLAVPPVILWAGEKKQHNRVVRITRIQSEKKKREKHVALYKSAAGSLAYPHRMWYSIFFFLLLYSGIVNINHFIFWRVAR